MKHKLLSPDIVVYGLLYGALAILFAVHAITFGGL